MRNILIIRGRTRIGTSGDRAALFGSENRWSLIFLCLAIFYSPVASAHGLEFHNPGASIEVDKSAMPKSFPFQVNADFSLIDQNGNAVTNESYQGQYMLVFFGYINCKNMCSISLARIGKALELLGNSIDKIAPLVITVDPERDTPETMKSGLAKFNPDMIGLTGNPAQLKTVYKNFKQKPEAAGYDWENDPIIYHSSYIYIMDGNGDFVTLFPPVLSPQSMADIILKYVDSTG